MSFIWLKKEYKKEKGDFPVYNILESVVIVCREKFFC